MMRMTKRVTSWLLFFVFIFCISITAFSAEKDEKGIYRRTADSFWSLTYKAGGVFKEGYKSVAAYFRSESPRIKEHGREIEKEIKKTNENLGKAFKEMGKEFKKQNEKVIKELKKKN